MRYDIFCHIIDNFGDIGVCWRLACQLALEHGLQVRLWVDDLGRLQALCPEIEPEQDQQSCRTVEIRRWGQPFPVVKPAQVVIEGFGCELPQNYLLAMSQCHPRPVWINLEYLSAEAWVEGCHGLGSPHPRLPLSKYFFFPGFSAASGGLLRESSLWQQREAWQRRPALLWQQLGLPPPRDGSELAAEVLAPAPQGGASVRPGNRQPETLVSLFCYDSAPIADLLEAWAASAAPVRCLLPQGTALAQAANWAGQAAPTADRPARRGNLTLQAIPFLPQQDYDRLLWGCDCNFVRGEDSFVRAQWAARPLLWQIYPQQGNAHQAKLDAFLDLYCQALSDVVASALRNFHQGWNAGGPLHWDDLWQHRAALQAHAVAWAGHLLEQADLASKLVIFCQKRV